MENKPKRTDAVPSPPRIVIVGGGFAGINAAKALAGARAEVILIDRRNYHLFQPLLYQVATATLSPADIAYPIRKILKLQRNAEVILGEVRTIDPTSRIVRLAADGAAIGFDYLILACGSTHSYFGHNEWEGYAPGLKTIEDATEIRRRFLLAFESAEMEVDSEARRAALTFVIVGGGPTGVELAGAMAEIARSAIPRDFRYVDTTTARIILIEGLSRLLNTFPESSSASALAQLTELGVEVMLNARVTNVDQEGVILGSKRIVARNVFWAAGVKASPVAESLGVPLDRAGHVVVLPDLSVPGHPEIFVIGDLAASTDTRTQVPVPHVAQGAMQMGRFVGELISRELRERGSQMVASHARPAFRYRDMGDMATIGRNRAVALLSGKWKINGLPAWLLWALVHVASLINFRSRFSVMLSWMWQYFLYDRGARLITGESRIQVVRHRDRTQENEQQRPL